MSSQNEHDITRQLAALDTEINALPPGVARDAVRASYEDLITLLADAGYTLRRGHELPAAWRWTGTIPIVGSVWTAARGGDCPPQNASSSRPAGCSYPSAATTAGRPESWSGSRWPLRAGGWTLDSYTTVIRYWRDSMTKRFTGIRIDEYLLDGLERLRDETGDTVAQSVRTAIREYLLKLGVIEKAERKRPASRLRS